jgi:hypothetical protein
MYADDLLLLSISICDLGLMIDLCVHEFDDIGMDINILKSGCLRVGDRHAAMMHPLLVHNQPLPWKQEIKYLGICLTAAKRFNFNIQNTVQKFYRALNGLFGKVGLNTSPLVLCSLVEKFCLPILMYSAEALMWKNNQKQSLENVYSHAYMKIFKTFDKKIIEYCQFSMGYLPFKLLLACRRLDYIDGLSSKQIKPLTLHFISTNTEYNEIIENFKLDKFKTTRSKVERRSVVVF